MSLLAVPNSIGLSYPTAENTQNGHSLVSFSIKSSDKPHSLQGRPLRLILPNESGAPCESGDRRGALSEPPTLFVSLRPCTHPLCQLLLATRPCRSLRFSWMFSKCHGKCQQSLNQWPTDILSLSCSSNHLSPWIWREVLIGLPPCLRHVSFQPRFFTRTARLCDSSRSFPRNYFKIWLMCLFIFFLTSRLRPPLARFVD